MLLAISMAGSFAFASGQSRSGFRVAGKVVEQGTGEPVVMASVVIKSLGLWAVTDAEGRFEIAGVPAGRQELEFDLNAKGKSLQEVLTEAVLHTYDITADSDALRADLGAFERLRGDYPVRREFTSFTVRLQDATPLMAEKLSKLGFCVK